MFFFLCLAVVAFAVVGVAMLIYAASVAPHAAETETGFHLTAPGDEDTFASPQEAMQSAPDLAFFNL